MKKVMLDWTARYFALLLGVMLFRGVVERFGWSQPWEKWEYFVVPILGVVLWPVFTWAIGRVCK